MLCNINHPVRSDLNSDCPGLSPLFILKSISFSQVMTWCLRFQPSRDTPLLLLCQPHPPQPHRHISPEGSGCRWQSCSFWSFPRAMLEVCKVLLIAPCKSRLTGNHTSPDSEMGRKRSCRCLWRMVGTERALPDLRSLPCESTSGESLHLRLLYWCFPICLKQCNPDWRQVVHCG
jgi:hypothetical protein